MVTNGRAALGTLNPRQSWQHSCSTCARGSRGRSWGHLEIRCTHRLQYGAKARPGRRRSTLEPPFLIDPKGAARDVLTAPWPERKRKTLRGRAPDSMQAGLLDRSEVVARVVVRKVGHSVDAPGASASCTTFQKADGSPGADRFLSRQRSWDEARDAARKKFNATALDATAIVGRSTCRGLSFLSPLHLGALDHDAKCVDQVRCTPLGYAMRSPPTPRAV